MSIKNTAIELILFTSLACANKPKVDIEVAPQREVETQARTTHAAVSNACNNPNSSSLKLKCVEQKLASITGCPLPTDPRLGEIKTLLIEVEKQLKEDGVSLTPWKSENCTIHDLKERTDVLKMAIEMQEAKKEAAGKIIASTK